MKKNEIELLLRIVCDRQEQLIGYRMCDNINQFTEYSDLEKIKVKLKKKLKKLYQEK